MILLIDLVERVEVLGLWIAAINFVLFYGIANLRLARPRLSPPSYWRLPQGKPQFYCIAEVHFPSIEALQRCAESDGGKETLAHAAKISSGGPPGVMIAEEDTFTF